jgi:hypothetical protein
MNTRHERHSSRRSWLRGGLLVLALTPLSGGLWPLPFPRSFYEDFPLPGRGWVSTLGPYNEHLVVDYGGLNLAIGVFLIFAAVFLERRLVQASLVAYLAFAVPHFVFHAGQTHHFSFGDNLAQLGLLGFLVLLPIVLLPLRNHGTPLRTSNTNSGFAASANAGHAGAHAPEDKEREHEGGATS